MGQTPYYARRSRRYDAGPPLTPVMETSLAFNSRMVPHFFAWAGVSSIALFGVEAARAAEPIDYVSGGFGEEVVDLVPAGFYVGWSHVVTGRAGLGRTAWLGRPDGPTAEIGFYSRPPAFIYVPGEGASILEDVDTHPDAHLGPPAFVTPNGYIAGLQWASGDQSARDVFLLKR
jgi:hypothetical protein